LQLEESGPTVIPNKVFATATINDGKRATLIPNYLRPRDEGELSSFRSKLLPEQGGATHLLTLVFSLLTLRIKKLMDTNRYGRGAR
jgi:hypothetical protein